MDNLEWPWKHFNLCEIIIFHHSDYVKKILNVKKISHFCGIYMLF